jgi:hypothetical protein
MNLLPVKALFLEIFINPKELSNPRGEMENIFKSKRGAEMTIGTMIIIILAIIVLAFLVFGFTTGWTNLWDKLSNWGAGETNVATVVQACKLSCETGDNYGYNNQLREVRFDKKDKGSFTCINLQNDINKGCYDGKGKKIEGVAGITSENCKKILEWENNVCNKITDFSTDPSTTAITKDYKDSAECRSLWIETSRGKVIQSPCAMG